MFKTKTDWALSLGPGSFEFRILAQNLTHLFSFHLMKTARRDPHDIAQATSLAARALHTHRAAGEGQQWSADAGWRSLEMETRNMVPPRAPGSTATMP